MLSGGGVDRLYPAIPWYVCVIIACWHAGNPVTWLISDREDAAIIECFLQAVKSQSPCVPINATMTDDGMKYTKIRH